MKQPVDILYLHARELVPLTDGPARGGVRGSDLAVASPISDGGVAVENGKIVATGPSAELEERFKPVHRVDLDDYLVVPGFVDCHTHPVFGATREEEFGLRCEGVDYVEIARKGGGILSSVTSLRGTTEESLVELLGGRFERFLALGTTTLEAKSGYGLSTESETKSLRALRAAADESPMTVHPTFLGAHEVAPAYRKDPDAYVRLLVDEMLPRARELAASCDIFVEEHVFGLAQSRRIAEAAKELGYRLRLHVDELTPLGGAELALDLDADSADHLLMVSGGAIARFGHARTTAVLLPGTPFFLRKRANAPARRLVDAGALVALATDFNPGSCFTQSLPMVATLARLNYGFKPAECLNAMTRNPAHSLGLDEDRGTLHDGKAADFVALDLPSLEAFGYGFGDNPVAMTVKDGLPVVLNRRENDSELLDRVARAPFSPHSR